MLENKGRFVEVSPCFYVTGREHGPHLPSTTVSARVELFLRELGNPMRNIFPVLYKQLVNGIRHFRWVLCSRCRHLCSEAYNATCDDERKEFHPESPSRRVMSSRRYVRFNFAPRRVRSCSTLDTGN